MSHAHALQGAFREPMFHPPDPKYVLSLVMQGQHALGMSQRELGDLLGSAKRTVQRWAAGQSTPSSSQLVELARNVHPKNADLAVAIVTAVGGTLESEGIVAPAPPPLAPVAPMPAVHVAPPIVPSAAHLVDSIVCAAADAMSVLPAAARPGLLAAFARARDIGLDVASAARALAETTAASKPDA